MWKRSEVEQLTGLGRHTIQNLCNKNTSRDGLGFWEPAVMKPGYSRFDEGDLLVFYLVRQFIKVGFTPAEAGPVVLDMLEEDEAFAEKLRAREASLTRQISELKSRLEALGRLERATKCPPEERPYAVMRCELMANAARATSALAGTPKLSQGFAESVSRKLETFARELMSKIYGEKTSPEFGLLFEMISGWRGREESFDHHEVMSAVLGMDEPLRGCPDDGHERVPLARAFLAFLNGAECGVPVELALGRGSFALLKKATNAWLEELDPQQNARKEEE